MYVDHAFSISDEDVMMMETSYTATNKPPIKEIALAVSLLVFGTLGIIIGSLMAYNHVGGDTAHGQFQHLSSPSIHLPSFILSVFYFFLAPRFPLWLFFAWLRKTVFFLNNNNKKELNFILRFAWKNYILCCDLLEI